jgi:hypothetical protein
MELIFFKARVVAWDPLLNRVVEAQYVLSAEQWKTLHEHSNVPWAAVEADIGRHLVWQCIEGLRAAGRDTTTSIWTAIWTAQVSINGQQGEIGIDELGALLG